jgi:hypothetical protein
MPLSAPPSLSCCLATLSSPSTASSAERFMARIRCIFGWSLEVTTCGSVCLCPALGCQSRTLLHRELLSSTNRQVRKLLSRHYTFLSKCGQSTSDLKFPPHLFLGCKDSQYAPKGAMISLLQIIFPFLKKFKSMAHLFRWMLFMVLERPVLT